MFDSSQETSFQDHAQLLEHYREIRARLAGKTVRKPSDEPPGLGSIDEYAEATKEVLVSPPPRTRIEMPLSQIKSYVCRKYEVSLRELISTRRYVKLVRARHEAFWLARQYTSNSFPEIGRAFGNRDHSTILHGARKYADLLDRGVVSRPNFKLRAIATQESHE
jgi:hypothetical protein